MKNVLTIKILLYYLVLLLILASRSSSTVEPPLLFRLVFMIAVVLPTIYNKMICYPAIIGLFYTLTNYGFAYSYMPYTLSIYVVITLLLFLYRWRDKSNKIPKFLIFFTVYIFFVDLFSSFFQPSGNYFQKVFYCFVLLILFLSLVKDNYESYLSQIPLCFAIVTIVLSLVFFTNKDKIIFDSYGDMDRSGWTDPNYFGMILGMGTITGFIKIYSSEWNILSLYEKIIYVLSVTISIPVLSLNASRGAVLSVLIAFLILLFDSKVKTYIKIFSVLISISVLFYLYNNHYLDLLEYRIQNDDGTGSLRTIIWTEKLEAFINGNPLLILFGYGRYGGVNITNQIVSFHNDYLSFLISYGLIGFSLFLYMMYYPLKVLPKQSKYKPLVLVIIIYLLICFITLEPFGIGGLSYFMFYLYALLIAHNEKRKLHLFVK